MNKVFFRKSEKRNKLLVQLAILGLFRSWGIIMKAIAEIIVCAGRPKTSFEYLASFFFMLNQDPKFRK